MNYNRSTCASTQIPHKQIERLHHWVGAPPRPPLLSFKKPNHRFEFIHNEQCRLFQHKDPQPLYRSAAQSIKKSAGRIGALASFRVPLASWRTNAFRRIKWQTVEPVKASSRLSPPNEVRPSCFSWWKRAPVRRGTGNILQSVARRCKIKLMLLLGCFFFLFLF